MTRDGQLWHPAELFRIEDAIAAGFGLPLASVRDVLVPCLARYIDQRAARLTGVMVSSPSRYGETPDPYVLMLRAASAVQHDPRRGTGWEWALSECERSFEDALAHYIAGFVPEDAARVTAALGCPSVAA